MKIKRYFRQCNLIMLAAPAVLIFLVTVGFLGVFILRFPVEQLYVTRLQMLNPMILFNVMLEFMKRNPMALGYLMLWLLLCAVIIIISTVVMTSRMSDKVTSALEELTEAADRIRNGELAFEMIGSDMEEINELCVSFDEMRRSLMSAKKRENAAENERSMMIANISHDLKTPITSIKGYINAINDGLAEEPEKLSRYLGVIKAKANSIESLVNNLSTLSSIEMSKLKMNFDVGELNDFVYEIAAEYRSDVQLSGLSLETELAQASVLVRIDYEKLKRVMINLIENAVKYRQDSSRVIKIVTEAEKSGAYIRIIDDGMGIEAQELDKIYDSFYRVDEARTSNIKGSGLGLGIAKELVKLHGGSLWLVSEGKGKGTTANIYLPYAERE